MAPVSGVSGTECQYRNASRTTATSMRTFTPQPHCAPYTQFLTLSFAAGDTNNGQKKVCDKEEHAALH
jgi:hypothetical protein